MSGLNVAIIGCGNIFSVHAEAVLANPAVNLKAVVDIDKNRALKAGKKIGCAYYTDYREIIPNQDLDVVHLCTPHYLHYPMAIDLLNADKHLLVEKPIAISTERAAEMVSLARKKGMHLGVAFQNRFNNTSLKAREILKQGNLGKVLGVKGIVTWHRDAAYYQHDNWRGKLETEGGGVLINQAIHTLDLMQWLGGEVKSVKGHITNHSLQGVVEVEDTAEAHLVFANGSKGVFYATNAFSTNSPVCLEVHCEGGILEIRDGKLFLIKDQKKEVLAIDYTPENHKSYWGKGHRRLINSFYNSILKGCAFDVSGEDGLEALKLVWAIYESSAKGKAVVV